MVPFPQIAELRLSVRLRGQRTAWSDFGTRRQGQGAACLRATQARSMRWRSRLTVSSWPRGQRTARLVFGTRRSGLRAARSKAIGAGPGRWRSHRTASSWSRDQRDQRTVCSHFGTRRCSADSEARAVYKVAVSPDGRLVSSTEEGCEVRLCDAVTGSGAAASESGPERWRSRQMASSSP
jgi:hypothetical protein